MAAASNASGEAALAAAGGAEDSGAAGAAATAAAVGEDAAAAAVDAAAVAAQRGLGASWVGSLAGMSSSVGLANNAARVGVHNREFVVFFTESLRPMAEGMVSAMSELASVFPNCEGLLRLGEISWNKFEDGFPNIMIEDIDRVRGRNVVFLASWMDHAELLPQLSVLYQLPRYLCKSLFVIMPYFPTGTMERVDTEGQIATAATFARLISAVPPTVNGPARVVMYDIHALQERFYFGDNVIPLLLTAIPLFQSTLEKSHAEELAAGQIVLAFPDDGACKRFGNKFPKEWGQIICNKVRVGAAGRKVVVKDGAEYINKDAHIFIVDDLVKTGGTLIECKDTLLAAGAGKVSAFVTHAVFPEESWKRFTEPKEEKGFDTFYVTDSVPETTALIQDKKPFQVIPLARDVVTAMLGF